jgi:hypothetical protein
MGKSIIFTAYFTSQPDPQRSRYWPQNDLSRIELYDSVKSLGLDMIIFHDHITTKLQNEYATDKIRFEYYKPNGNILTQRWYAFHEHLKTNDYDFVFCLDADTQLFKNPFELIDEDNLLIGSEDGIIKGSEWMKDWFRRAYGETFFGDNQILNCGILGGTFENIYNLLILFRRETQGMAGNVDMAVFNRLVYDSFDFKTGFPLHTVFNKDEGAESGCYIKHK